MTIEIDKNKVIVRKPNLIFVLIDYGTEDDLARLVSAWIEAEIHWESRR